MTNDEVTPKCFFFIHPSLYKSVITTNQQNVIGLN